MHVAVAVFYGFVVWACFFAYTIILQGSIIKILLVGPFIVSGVAAAMMAVGLACSVVAGWIRKVISSFAG